MTDIIKQMADTIQQGNTHSRAMIEEGINLGRREALFEIHKLLRGAGHLSAAQLVEALMRHEKLLDDQGPLP